MNATNGVHYLLIFLDLFVSKLKLFHINLVENSPCLSKLRIASNPVSVRCCSRIVMTGME